MAPATQASPRIRTTITKETLPAVDSSPADAKPTPFYDRDWEVVMSDLTPEEWQGHIVRVYRANEKWERGAGPIENTFTAPFTEEDIRARFGGGRYVLWLYGPPKRHNLVGRYNVELEGAPIVGSVPRNNSGMDGGSNAVAMQALNMMNNPQIMAMQMEMMKAATIQAIDIVRSQMPAPQNPLETLRAAKEILGGGSQQTDLLSTIRTLKELGIIGSSEKKGVQETLELITTLKTAGLMPSAPVKADLLSTFAANIPMLADRVVAGFQEARMHAEAEERVIRLRRGEMNANDPQVITLNNPAKPAAAAPAPDPSTTANRTSAPIGQVDEATASAIILQYNLQRLVAGIKEPGSTGQDMYDFLLNAWPEVLDELAKFSKESLLLFFKSEPMQMQQFGNAILLEVAEDPRLPQMIEDFLRIAKENAVPEPEPAAV